MVRFSSAAGIALALAPSIRGHTLPPSYGMARLTQRDDGLGKTPLLDDFSALFADPSRIPPMAQGTAVKWDAGQYPQNCYDKAREAISDDNANPKCALSDLKIYNVTYSDCPSGRDPWILCRCANAEMSLQDYVDGLGTVPTGARSNVLHLVAMNGYGGGGGYSDMNSIFAGGVPDKTWFTHESMHCNDRDSWSGTDNFTNAINADTCVPDNYSNNDHFEDFAQVGVYLNYDINGHNIADYTGKDASCMSNQLQAARLYLAERLDINGTCFPAPGTDSMVNGTPKRDARPNIIEKDPKSGYESLLPHTPYGHAGFFHSG